MMYRFLVRPKWIAFTLLVVGAAVLMANLGRWQLHRLEDRKDFNALVTERIEASPVVLREATDFPVDEYEWRTVTLDGKYLGETERAATAGGYLLVTPFGINTGDTVYVDRGFVGSAAEVPPPPEGRVLLTARIRTAPDSVESVPDGALYLDRISSAPDEPDVAPRELPSLDDGPHLSYAIQWFIFSICVVIGWVLAVRRSARPNVDAPVANDPAAVRRRRRQQAVPWQDEPGDSSPDR